MSALEVIERMAAVIKRLSSGVRWRHKKRGTTYTELARGEVQSSTTIVEGERLVAYMGDDGKVWFRPEEEFDGRFERA